MRKAYCSKTCTHVFSFCSHTLTKRFINIPKIYKSEYNPLLVQAVLRLLGKSWSCCD